MAIASHPLKPLCFVLMPFGRKPDTTGRIIDFDAIFRSIIVPAIEQAGLQPIRADQEQVGGAIHKPMFERLMLCDYAIADVTGANPNVYYELGIRHALRPRTTTLIFAHGTSLPFDIAPLRGIHYNLDAAGIPASPAADADLIASRLRSANQNPIDDSPLFTLINDMPRLQLDYQNTELFRDRINHEQACKAKFAAARKQGPAALREAAAECGSIQNAEAGVVMDLFLSFGSVKAWAEMIELYGHMSPTLQQTRVVQEQLALAWNRHGDPERAETILENVLKKFGKSSETYGLLGRVFKDRWEAARSAGRSIEARGHLKRAIRAYREGFETDWRDPYPGVNAVTLMEMEDALDPAQSQMLPVVRYSAAMRAKSSKDYWDHATLLELAILSRDQAAAEEHCAAALAHVHEPWKRETTARNITLIREARARRSEPMPWVSEIEQCLLGNRQ